MNEYTELPMASPELVRSVIEQLRAGLPEGWFVEEPRGSGSPITIVDRQRPLDRFGPVWPRAAWWLYPDKGAGGSDPTLYADDVDGKRIVADVLECVRALPTP